jgi:putative membrane protein
MRMKNELLATLAAAAMALGTMSGTAIAHGDMDDRSGSESGTRLSSEDRDVIRDVVRDVIRSDNLLSSRNQDLFASDAGLSSRDRRFIRKAAEGAYFEIAAGRMAATKGATAEVQALGTRLAADHTAGLTAIVALAETYAVHLPDTMSDEQQDVLDRVARRDGLRFDDAFTELAKKDHRQDLAAFRRQVRKGRNAEVRAFAEATIPVLKGHLAAAKVVNAVVEQQQDAIEQQQDVIEQQQRQQGRGIGMEEG